MQKTKHQTPWWAIAQLWGLEAPIAALCWALAFSKILWITQVPLAVYFFLFVAVWVLSMLLRMARVFSKTTTAMNDWRAPFYRDHFIPLSCVTLAMMAAGVWIALFQVGVGLLGYCSLPFMFGCLYFLSGAFTHTLVKNIRPLFGALSFAFGCLVPPWFYTISRGWDEFLVYRPCYSLAILLYLYFQFRKYWMQRRLEKRDASSDLALNILLLAYLIYTLVVASFVRGQEQYFYYALAVGSGGLQLMDRFRSRLSDEALHSLSWAGLALAAIFSCCLSL